jgi:L-cystine uptake protein TcyP (sodium:dicarboxylate symporter family)
MGHGVIRAAEAACQATSWPDVAMALVVLVITLAPLGVLLIMIKWDRS